MATRSQSEEHNTDSITMKRSITEMTTVSKQSNATILEHQQQQKVCEQNYQRNHTKSTIALCACMMAHSCLLISVFPYSGYMAIHLVKTANEENAGSYAGLIASSFMAGRAFCSYIWGKAADIYGRTFVIKVSLILSAFFTLMFGLSCTFPAALTFRFLLGLSNGLVGPVKTAVSELARGDDKLESRAMGLVIGMWGWGFLIFPAMGGALSEPVRQYPHSAVVKDFEPFLSRFPFLLPNLAGAILCVTALIGVTLYVEETLPIEKRRSAKYILRDLFDWFQHLFTMVMCRVRDLGKNGVVDETLPLRSSDSTQSEILLYDAIDPCSSTPGDDDDEEEAIKQAKLRNSDSSSALFSVDLSAIKREKSHETPSPPTSPAAQRRQKSDSSKVGETATVASLWKRKNTRIHLLVYWLFSFVVTCIDEAFPLFCISKDIGLGLSEVSIGKILSISGIIFAFLNYFVFSSVVNKCGLYPSLYLGTFLSSPMVIFIPLSIIINNHSSFTVKHDDEGNDTLSWATTIFLSFIMSWNRIFAMVFFASITIATNRTVPASHRATMNGLSMLGGSAAKAIGPTFAGFLVAFSASSGVINPHVGSFLIFAVIGLLGLSVGFICLLSLKEEGVDERGENNEGSDIIAEGGGVASNKEIPIKQ